MNRLPGNLMCALPPCWGICVLLSLTLKRTPIAVRSSSLSHSSEVLLFSLRPVSLVAALTTWCRVSTSCCCWDGSTAALDVMHMMLERSSAVAGRFRILVLPTLQSRRPQTSVTRREGRGAGWGQT